MKKWLFGNLSKYALCDFFLHKCVDSMSAGEIAMDLKNDPQFSLLQHFDKREHMEGLEQLFSQTMTTFHLSRGQLKAKAEFNFDVYDLKGFESVRGVFRFANAAAKIGFTDFGFLGGKGIADLVAKKDETWWFIEVKTLVLQTKALEFNIGETSEFFAVDKLQPKSNAIADYIESFSRKVAGDIIDKARQQLLDTVAQKGHAKKMIALVVNLLAGDFFLDNENLLEVHHRLCGKRDGWEKNYLADTDGLAFLTDHLFVIE